MSIDKKDKLYSQNLSLEKNQANTRAESEKTSDTSAIKEGLDARLETAMVQKGRIVRWNTDRGFGFIRLEGERKRDLFCHISALCRHLKPARGESPDLSKPVFVTETSVGPRGLKAEKVDCETCNLPTIWELKPVGEPIFGIREMKDVCNKPDEYNSPISYTEIYNANIEYEKAKKKLRLWEGEISEEFFQTFGEARNISVNGEELILTYEHGDKTVSLSEAFYSKHWKTSPTGQWEKFSEKVVADFIFDDIPGAKLQVWIASSYINPYLTPSFKKLTKSIQEEILEILKPLAESPEKLASDQFEARINHYEKAKELRNDIINLQRPEKPRLVSGMQTVQKRNTWSYGGETWETGGSYNTKVKVAHLITGSIKLENNSWKNYSEGHYFSISQTELKKTAEEVRDILLEEKKAELERFFEESMKFAPLSEDHKPLYDISAEEWSDRYSAQLNKLIKETKDKWQAEDAAILNSLTEEWNKINTAKDKLLEAREKLETVYKRERKFRLNLELLSIDTNTDYKKPEEINKITATIYAYIEAANSQISAKLKERGEVEVEVELSDYDCEAPAQAAPWFLDGVSPETFEKYGRKKGEGFGLKIAGERRYLPGIRPVLGIQISAGTRRYFKEVEYFGLEELSRLSRKISKRTDEILAIVTNPDWRITWVHYHDGKPFEYALINSKGTSTTFVAEGKASAAHSHNWDGERDQGPSLEEILKAHDIVAFINPEDSSTNISKNETEKIVEAVEVPEVTFTLVGGRYVKCSDCERQQRLTKGQMKKYKNGDLEEITCKNDCCNGKGKVE